MSDVIEIKTDSDLIYPIPGYVNDHFKMVCFALTPHSARGGFAAQLGVGPSDHFLHYAMDINEMTLDHFGALTGVQLVVMCPAGVVDSALPLVMYQQPFQVITMSDATSPSTTPKHRNWKKMDDGHRPLRLLLTREDVRRGEIEEFSVDTGIGASTVLHFIEKEENTLLLSHGLAFRRQVIPRNGPLKQFIDLRGKNTLVLQTSGTLSGDGKRKHSLDNSDEDPFDDIDQQLEDKFVCYIHFLSVYFFW